MIATSANKPKPASGQSDVFNENEAAAYLKITKRTCRDWRARRGLPACKPTAQVTLYRKADLDEWLLRSRVATPPRLYVRLIFAAIGWRVKLLVDAAFHAMR